MTGGITGMIDMTDMQVNTTLGAGICFLSGIIGLILWRSGKKQNNQGKQEIEKIPIERIAEWWIKNGAGHGMATCEFHIEKLAPLWREEKAAQDVSEDHEFQNARIQEFYKLHIQRLRHASQPSQHHAICSELLSLLDKEGNCSSVVNVSRDVEASWNSTTYTLLGQTNLMDHSLNVAEEAIRLLEESDAGYIVPDALIVALAHDIGKLPSIKGYLYSLGEHPLTAGRVLSEIDAFGQLAKKDELLRAIKLHHKHPDNLLGKTLKRADQLARQKELDQAQERLPPLEAPVKSMERPMDFLAEEVVEKKGEAPKLLNISAWFDAMVMLEQMKPQINQLAGRRFAAFSMANGYVYFQPKIIEEIARKQAEQAGVLDVVSMETEEMRQVLLSIVHQLRQEDVIADGLLQRNYFGAYFTITMKSGVTMKGYYTPFHAEPFGSIATMEKSK
ncbi:MAG: HD domain-containing protein, partial [Desulfocapsa sp.]|nr:HD domain-containing protein [Desulfocapsa sp.]